MLQLVSHGRGKKMRANRFVEGRERVREFSMTEFSSSCSPLLIVVGSWVELLLQEVMERKIRIFHSISICWMTLEIWLWINAMLIENVNKELGDGAMVDEFFFKKIVESFKFLYFSASNDVGSFSIHSVARSSVAHH